MRSVAIEIDTVRSVAIDIDTVRSVAVDIDTVRNSKECVVLLLSVILRQ